MESIGESLAEARRKQKLTVKDVERAIKIRAKYISALEKDNFDQISGEAYVIGFIKVYANWLNIDPKPLIARYKKDFGFEKTQSSHLNENEVFGSNPHSKPQKDRRIFVIIAVLGVFIIFVIIRVVLSAGIS